MNRSKSENYRKNSCTSMMSEPERIIVSTRSLTIQQALEMVGSHGKYQKWAFVLFCLQWFVAGFILMSPPFLLKTPTFDCKHVHRIDSPDQCMEYVCSLEPNQRRHYMNFGNKKYQPITKEFSLYCENRSFVGFFVFPPIADNKGRKVALISSWFVCFVGAAIMVVSNSYIHIIIGYFLLGLGVNPAITVHYSFMNEHSLGSFREYSQIAVQVCFGLGQLAFTLMAYYFLAWRSLVLFAFTIPTFLLNFPNFALLESPQFLYEKDRNKCVEVLNKIARINGEEQYITENQLEQNGIVNGEQKQFGFFDLFKYKSLRLVSYAAIMIFFSMQAVYYGSQFAMATVGLDMYSNIFLMGCSETVAYAITDFFIPNLKRRKTVFIGLFICFILCTSFIFMNIDKCDTLCPAMIFQVVFAVILRFIISFVATLYIYFSEIFPTVVRSLALGITSTCGTLGAFGTPYLVQYVPDWLSPMVVLGLVSLIGAAHVFPLQETQGAVLENQIEELKKSDKLEDVHSIDMNNYQMEKVK